MWINYTWAQSWRYILCLQVWTKIHKAIKNIKELYVWLQNHIKDVKTNRFMPNTKWSGEKLWSNTWGLFQLSMVYYLDTQSIYMQYLILQLNWTSLTCMCWIQHKQVKTLQLTLPSCILLLPSLLTEIWSRGKDIGTHATSKWTTRLYSTTRIIWGF